MGHVIAFDTHAYVKKLVAVGVKEAQAEVQAEMLTQLLDDNLVSKHDMKEMETSLRHDMADLRGEMKELEMRLTIRLGAIMAAGIAIVATLVKLL